MKSIPTVMKYMSTTPHSINTVQNLTSANELMKKNNIRHLPVMHDGQIKGIISDRDLKLALSIHGVDPDKTTVDEISNSEVFLVKPDSKLDEVVRVMGEKKIGSVLVVDNHRLVGIFTTTDALTALGEILESRLHH